MRWNTSQSMGANQVFCQATDTRNNLRICFVITIGILLQLRWDDVKPKLETVQNRKELDQLLRTLLVRPMICAASGRKPW